MLVDVVGCYVVLVYNISNTLIGIHKKFPHILSWETLQGFTSAASFADFIEEYNSELTHFIEQRARDAGTFFHIITLLLL